MGRTCSLVSIKGRGGVGVLSSSERSANQKAPTPLSPRPVPYKVAKKPRVESAAIWPRHNPDALRSWVQSPCLPQPSPAQESPAFPTGTWKG